MKGKISFLILLALSFTLTTATYANSLNLMEGLFLKITVIENDTEHEWEYTSPGKYEYEKDEKIIKTTEAKEEMLSIVKTMDLSEKAKIEEMVLKLKEARFPNLERLDIRWMNGNNQLYTWVWEKDN